MVPVAVSGVVVNHRRRALLEHCLDSLRPAFDELGEPCELIVVDNGSDDGSIDLVRERHPDAQLVALPRNVGFAGGVNEGLARSRGEWALLLNNDATLARDAVRLLLAAGRSSPDVGSVAAQMRFADRPGVINSGGIEIDRLGVAYDRLLGEPAGAGESRTAEVFGASAGAALFRREMLERIGGFDDSFFVFLEDADVAWRARMAGWRCLYEPRAIVYHHHSATAGHASPFKHFHVGRNRVRLLAKNAAGRQLARYGPAMIAYDAAYVAFAAVSDRTLAPLRGRLRGLREWRSYRRAAGVRRPVTLAPVRGVRAALERRSSWTERGPQAGEPGPPTSSGGPSR
jgi:GT2 family glycosyltransferase